MPTVTYKCGDTGKNKKRKFAYNAVGKAQADSFSRMNDGSLKMNPGPKEEKKTKATIRKKNKINFDTTASGSVGGGSANEMAKAVGKLGGTLSGLISGGKKA